MCELTHEFGESLHISHEFMDKVTLILVERYSKA